MSVLSRRRQNLLPPAPTSSSTGQARTGSPAGLRRRWQETKADAAAGRAARRARPGARGWPGRGAGRVSYLEAPPEYRGSTVQVCGLWPFSAGSSTPTVGVPLGRHLLTSTTVCGDPVFWFLNNLVLNPSAFVLGRPGLGKSSLVRRMVTVLSAWGINPLILSDLKPDYVDLVRALGGQVITVARGRGHVNPLDPGPLLGALDELPEEAREQVWSELHGRRVNTLTGLLALVRGGPLADHEQTLVSTALRVLDTQRTTGPDSGADGRGAVPLISDVLALVRDAHPQLRAVALDRGDLERYRNRTENLEASLIALGPEGPFGDTFARPTSTPMRLDTPVVFDVSAVDDSDVVLQAAVQLVCWSYGSAAVSTAKHLADARLAPQRHYLMIMDELWRILRASPYMVDRIDALTRLNRQRGLGQVMLTHTMNDLRLSTEEATAKAWGFVERSAMVFLGGLADKEMGNLREVFAMSGAEQAMITDWSTEGGYDPDTGTAGEPPGLGNFLLKVGKKPGVPFHMDMTTVEKQVNDTNKSWHDIASRIRQQVLPPAEQEALAEAHELPAVDDEPDA